MGAHNSGDLGGRPAGCRLGFWRGCRSRHWRPGRGIGRDPQEPPPSQKGRYEARRRSSNSEPYATARGGPSRRTPPPTQKKRTQASRPPLPARAAAATPRTRRRSSPCKGGLWRTRRRRVWDRRWPGCWRTERGAEGLQARGGAGSPELRISHSRSPKPARLPAVDPLLDNSRNRFGPVQSPRSARQSLAAGAEARSRPNPFNRSMTPPGQSIGNDQEQHRHRRRTTTTTNKRHN